MHHITQDTKQLARAHTGQSTARQKQIRCTRVLRFMLHSALRLTCIMAFCLMLTGCAGYSLTADAPSVLGDGSKTIKIKGVENPTLYANLPYIVRSDVRNEITARNLAEWRDSGPTDYTLQIRITRLTLRRWAGLEEDTETIFTSTMGMEFIVYDGKSNDIVWQSGVKTYSENVDTFEEGAAMELSSQRLTEEILDDMRRNF